MWIQFVFRFESRNWHRTWSSVKSTLLFPLWQSAVFNSPLVTQTLPKKKRAQIGLTSPGKAVTYFHSSYKILARKCMHPDTILLTVSHSADGPRSSLFIIFQFLFCLFVFAVCSVRTNNSQVALPLCFHVLPLFMNGSPFCANSVRAAAGLFNEASFG